MKGIFSVVGTDTEIGKTYSVCHLLKRAASKGMTTLGLKPIAAGSHALSANELKALQDMHGEAISLSEKDEVNEDAVALLQHSTRALPYSQINPILLKGAKSPHIAAEEENRRVRASQIVGLVRGTITKAAPATDLILIEGAGGWHCPLNARERYSDVMRELGYPVILVIGIRLGCLNHAMLTYESIVSSGVPIAGWVANELSADIPDLDQQINYLESRINGPLIERIPYGG